MEGAHHNSQTVTLSFPSRPHNIVTLALSRYNSQSFHSYKLQLGLHSIRSLVDVGYLGFSSQTGGLIDLDAKPRKSCFTRVYSPRTFRLK